MAPLSGVGATCALRHAAFRHGCWEERGGVAVSEEGVRRGDSSQ